MHLAGRQFLRSIRVTVRTAKIDWGKKSHNITRVCHFIYYDLIITPCYQNIMTLFSLLFLVKLQLHSLNIFSKILTLFWKHYNPFIYTKLFQPCYQIPSPHHHSAPNTLFYFNSTKVEQWNILYSKENTEWTQWLLPHKFKLWISTRMGFNTK